MAKRKNNHKNETATKKTIPSKNYKRSGTATRSIKKEEQQLTYTNQEQLKQLTSTNQEQLKPITKNS